MNTGMEDQTEGRNCKVCGRTVNYVTGLCITGVVAWPKVG